MINGEFTEYLDRLSGGTATGLNFIEQLHALSLKSCSNPAAPMLIAIERNNANKALVMKAGCKMWSCPECSARMGKRWIATALNHINKESCEWYFMTLTSHSRARSPEASKRVLSDGWRKLSLRMKRAYGKFDYLRVWELHKSGAYHQHYITNLKMPYTTRRTKDSARKSYSCRWLKDNAAAVGMGYQVDYRPIDNAAYVAGYVAKYTLKQAEPDTARAWIKGTRRIETSYGWRRLPDDQKNSLLDWKIAGTMTALEYWHDHYTKLGVDLYPLWMGGEKLTAEYFEKERAKNRPDAPTLTIDWTDYE